MKRLFTLLAFFSLNTALVQAQCIGSEPIISQVAEGSSNNKTVEIYNPTAAPLDLSAYTLVRVANGNGLPGTTITLSGIIAPGDVFVISNPSADASILGVSDQTSGTITHNGNDSYVLYKGSTIIDSYGNVDSNTNFGVNMNMQRNLSGPCPYDTDPSDAFDPAAYTSTSYTSGLPPGLGNPIGIVPVVLSSFEVSIAGNTSRLSWTTSSEINNEYFAVQHSINGVDFEEIAYVEGNGTTNESKEYHYTHFDPSKNINYYRLKQVDYDGAYEYSEIQTVRMTGEDRSEFSVYPTAFTDRLFISSEHSIEDVSIHIFNSQGVLVLSSLLQGNEINLSALASGPYILQIEEQSNLTTQKVIKL